MIKIIKLEIVIVEQFLLRYSSLAEGQANRAIALEIKEESPNTEGQRAG